MSKTLEPKRLLARRKRRVRKSVAGTTERPRLHVHRTTKHIYAQIIDDSASATLAAASSLELKIDGGNVAGAKEVGKRVAEKAKEKNIEKIAFDRGGHQYHGRVKALAEAAREAGLQF